MIAKFLMWGAVLAVGLQVAGCYTDYGPVVIDSTPVAPMSVAARLHAGDKLKIIVYGEDNLSGLYDVSPGGMLTMPLIGSVKAAGRSRTEVERDIAGRYRTGSFLQEPKVTISVVEYQPFYVMGEAEHPGQYPYRSDLDVLTAIATAGGFTYRASKTSVLIRHADETVWQKYSLAAPIPVEPGDLIRVPERYF
jgi:protein involved in polysaccharide export with SLBB domain